MTARIPTTTRPPLDPHLRAVTVGLLTVVSLFAFESIGVGHAMPTVARDLHGVGLYPVAVNGLITASMLGMVLAGTWIDARGVSAPLASGGALFAAGLLFSGLAQEMFTFVAGRFLQGFGTGLTVVALYAVVGQAYPLAHRTRMLSLFAAAWVVPAIVGPFVAGAMVETWGWRSLFLVVAGVAALAVISVQRGIRGQVDRPRRALVRGSRPALVLALSGGAVLLHVAGQTHGTLRLAGGATALMILALTAPRLLPAGTYRAAPGFPSVILLRGLAAGVFMSAETLLPLWLQTERSLSPLMSGVVLTSGAVGWAGASAYIGRNAAPEQFASYLRTGTLLLLVGAATACALTTPVASILLATLACLLLGCGMGIVTPVLGTMALSLGGEDSHGSSGSALQLSDAVGQSVTAGVTGLMFATWLRADHQTAYLAGFGPSMLLAVLATSVAWRRRRATAA